MFERYNESARKILLLSRSIAGELGGSAIEPSHILLAVLQQSPELFRLWMRSEEELTSLREMLEAQGRGSGNPCGAEMHLTAEAKAVLAFAAEEGDRRGHTEIRPWHLLAGILRSNGPAAEALREAGADPMERAGLESPQYTTMDHDGAAPGESVVRPLVPKEARLVFVAASKGLADAKTETADLFRLIEQLPPSQLGRARVLLQALVESHRAGHLE